MAGGSKNHRRILGREPWSAAQKRSWGRKTRRALQLAPLFVSLDRADAIIEGARYIRARRRCSATFTSCASHQRACFCLLLKRQPPDWPSAFFLLAIVVVDWITASAPCDR